MKHYCLRARLKSSLAHTEEVSSNIANIYREKTLIDKDIHFIPALHGNSIRGTLRDVGADLLCTKVGVEENSLPVRVFNILFSGGALDKADTEVNINIKKDIRSTVPLLSIFGSAMGKEMLQGKLSVTSALPECTELETGERSYNDLVALVRYTRQDDTKKTVGEKHSDTEEDIKSQMFYDTEVIAKGSILRFDVYLDTENELEVSAFESTLEKFLERPFFGGMSRAGHGQVEFIDLPELNSKPYLDFLEKEKEDIKEFLKNEFTRQNKPAKGELL